MNSQVCIDASFIINLLIPSKIPGINLETERLFEKWGKSGIDLIAPSLLTYEVTSVLRIFVHTGQLKFDHGLKILKNFQLLDIKFIDLKGVPLLAFELANRFNQKRAYDTIYLALATIRTCEYWTADQHFYNAVKGSVDNVKLLGKKSS